jgi:hypothetical protein
MHDGRSWAQSEVDEPPMCQSPHDTRTPDHATMRSAARRCTRQRASAHVCCTQCLIDRPAV